MTAILALLACAAAVVVFRSGEILSFRVMRFVLARGDPAGVGEGYTWELHKTVFRVVAAVVLLVCLSQARVRRRVRDTLASLAMSILELGEDLRAFLGRTWREEGWAHWAALAVIVGAGIAVRIPYLRWPMRYDEAFTFWWYARYPLKLALSTYDAPNNHLFNTFLIHVAYRLFGDAPWALRLPGFVVGSLTLPVTYLVGRSFVGGAAALLAAAALATSMVMIEASTNGRGYSILALVFLLLLGLGQYLRARDNAAAWAAFAALGAIGVYTVPSGIYAFGTVVLWLLLSGLTGEAPGGVRRFVVRLAIATVVAGFTTLMLYAPILLRDDLSAILSHRVIATKVESVTWPVFFEGNRVKAIDTWRRWTLDWPMALRVILGAGILTFLARHARISTERVPVWIAFLGATVPILLVQRVVPFSRIWIFLFPWVCFMGMGGVVYLLRRLAGLGRERMDRVAVLLALLLLVAQAVTLPSRSAGYFYNDSSFPDAERAALTLKPVVEHGDPILLRGTFLVPFLYYCLRYDLPCFDFASAGVPGDWWRTGRRRIFVVVNELGPPLNEVGQTLESVLERSKVTGVGRVTLLARHPTSRVYMIEGREQP